MKNPSRPETTDEFMRRLQMDPEYQAMMAEKDRKQAEVEARLAEAEKPVIEDLLRVNIKVKSVWDLVNTPFSYAPAVPVLIRHLRRPYPRIVLEGIGRALGVREAIPYWDELAALYRQTPDITGIGPGILDKGSLKEGLAVALSATGGPPRFEEMADLLMDRSNGPTRAHFAYALARTRDVRTWAILEQLADEPDLYGAVEDLFERRERNARRRARKQKGRE